MSVDADLKTINKESPKREVKERWLIENPGMNSADFEAHRERPEFKTWEAEIDNWTKVTNSHWNEQNIEIKGIEDLDKKLKISRDFVDASLGVKTLYDKLVNRFEESEFFGGNNPAWNFPKEATQEWKALTYKKDAQVQRSALDLSSLIAKTGILAKEEMSAATVNISKTVKDAFTSATENLEKALKKWDTLLAGEASPDRWELRKVASELNDRLNEFTIAHAHVFAEKTAPIYVKYEVLATVKAVSDKVAAQLSARTTNPDVTSMYSRIRDVPRSTTRKKVQPECKEIASDYKNDFKMFWDVHVGNLQTVAGRQTDAPNLRLELKVALSKVTAQYDLGKSLQQFADAYSKANPADLAFMGELSSAVAEITFKIPKYQAAVEQAFENSPTSADIRKTRDEFRKLFDVITQYVQNRVENLEVVLK